MTSKKVQVEPNFSFQRRGQNGQIIVSNNLSYSMAEYNEYTGVTRWQRVVPAAQREKVQVFLLAQYPVKSEPPATKSKVRAVVA